MQERFQALAADPAEVDRIIAQGAQKAQAMAAPTLARAMAAVGLLPRRALHSRQSSSAA